MSLGGSGSGGGDIRAGGAFVEVSTKNNVAPGLAAAGSDVRAFAATVTSQMKAEAAAAAKQQEALRRGMDVTRAVRTGEEKRADSLKELTGLLLSGSITNETYARGVKEINKQFDESKKGEKGIGVWAGALLKVGAAVGVVQQAFSYMMGKAGEAVDKATERADELADAWQRAFGRDVSRRDKGLGLGGPADQAKATKAALDALDLPARASQLNAARKALDDYNKANKFEGNSFLDRNSINLLGLEKSEHPWLFTNFNKGDKANLEQNVKDSQKQYNAAAEAAERYRDRMRELRDPTRDTQLVAEINAATKAIKEQADTFEKAERDVQRYHFALQGATPAMLKAFDVESARLKKLEDAQYTRQQEQLKFEDYQDAMTAIADAQRDYRQGMKNIDEDLELRARVAMEQMGNAVRQTYGMGNLKNALDFGVSDGNMQTVEQLRKSNETQQKQLQEQQKLNKTLTDIKERYPEAFVD